MHLIDSFLILYGLFKLVNVLRKNLCKDKKSFSSFIPHSSNRIPKRIKAFVLSSKEHWSAVYLLINYIRSFQFPFEFAKTFEAILAISVPIVFLIFKNYSL